MPDIFDSQQDLSANTDMAQQETEVGGALESRDDTEQQAYIESDPTDSARATNAASTTDQGITGDSDSSNTTDSTNPTPTAFTINTPAKDHSKSHRHHHRHQVDSYSEVMRREKPTNDHFSWFIPKPLKMHFSEQDPEEELILVMRKHPATQIRWVLIAIALAIAPIIITKLGVFSLLSGKHYMAGVISWYLVILGYSVESILKWAYNVYIVTDERIIDVDFFSLLNRNIATAKIDKIEDVKTVTDTFLETVFDMGHIEVQTAGTNREFLFKGIPYPNKVAALLNELILQEERERIEGRVR